MKQVIFITLLLSSIHSFAQEKTPSTDSPWTLHYKLGTQSISEFNVALEYKTSYSSSLELETSLRYPFFGQFGENLYNLALQNSIYDIPYRRGVSIRPAYIHYFNKREKGAYASLSPGAYLAYFYLTDTYRDYDTQDTSVEYVSGTLKEQVFSFGPFLNLGIHFRKTPKVSLYFTGGVRFNQIFREQSEEGGPWESSFYRGRSPIARIGVRFQLF